MDETPSEDAAPGTPVLTEGGRLVERMRGRASTTMSTDELMSLLRGE